MKITINQIAEELNLSRNTISKVLNKKGGVSEKTKQMVIEKARQMGYKQADFSLTGREHDGEGGKRRQSEKRKLLLVTSRIPINEHFGVRALESFQEEINTRGYSLDIAVVTRQEIRERRLPRGIEDEETDGLICIEMFDRDYSSFLCEYGKPILFMDAAVGLDESYPNMDLILMENRHSVEALMESMLSKSCRKFGFVGDKKHCRSFFERWEACNNVLKQVGITDFQKYSICDTDQEKYHEYRWLHQRVNELAGLPEVFFCANDQIGVTLIRALREMKISVPDEVKVIGFDDMPAAAISNPTLTTVRINSAAIGEIAADLILSRIRNPKLPSRYTYVQTVPIFRESTGI